MRTKLFTLLLFISISLTGCSDDLDDCVGTIGLALPVEDMTLAANSGAVQFDVFEPPAIFTRDLFVEDFVLRIAESSDGSVVNVRVLENTDTGVIQIFEITPVGVGQAEVTLTALNACSEAFNTTDTFTVTVTQ